MENKKIWDKRMFTLITYKLEIRKKKSSKYVSFSYLVILT